MTLLAGCTGAQFDGAVYRDKELAFRIGPPPASAHRIDTDEARLAFRDEQAGSTLAVSARCHQDGDDVPLRALVQHLFIQFTDQRPIGQREFRLAGRAALEVELEASLDGVRSHFVVVVLKRDSCVYDFVHMDGGGAEARLEQSREAFRAMVGGFAVLD